MLRFYLEQLDFMQSLVSQLTMPLLLPPYFLERILLKLSSQKLIEVVTISGPSAPEICVLVALALPVKILSIFGCDSA